MPETRDLSRRELLSDLAEQLLAAEAPVDAASAAYRTIAPEFDLHAYFNFLAEPDGTLRLDSFDGIPGHVAHEISQLAPGEGICGLAARRGETVHAAGIQSSGEKLTELIRRFGFRAYFCSPLLVNGRLLGTLSFGTKSRDHFTGEELSLITTVVRYVALAVERLRAERGLRASEERLRATIEAIADAVIIYDLEGRIVRMNPAAERLFAYTPEIRHKPLAERSKWVSAETPDGTPFPVENSPALRALRGETVTGEIMVFHLPPGRTTWSSASAAPIRTPEGEIAGAVATFTDISALHDLQREREMYVHTISHDLRTPLTVVHGHAELLAEACRDEQLRPHIEAILKGAGRMNKMIEDLVEAARLEGGEIKLEKRAIRLDRFLCDFLRRSSAALETSRIAAEVPPDLPKVSADPTRLERILTNLLTSALKYSPPESRVEVRAKPDEKEIVVSVHDRGEGIPPEDLPHIFDRFYRPSRGKKAGSVGLGLYITRSLVEAHGGQVCAESEPGAGSDFYFTLPVQGDEERR